MASGRFSRSWDLRDRTGSQPIERSRRREPFGSLQGQAVNWDDTIIDAAATDTGMRRANNQDSHTAVRASHAAAWRQRGHVFMVADGMGAHAVGELASKMACDLIPHTYMKARAGTPSEAITKAFREVSSLIYSRASANRDFQGMGTTCSALVLLPEGGAHLSRGGFARLPHPPEPDRSVLVRPQPGLGAGAAQPFDLGAGQPERSQERHHAKPGAGGRHRSRHRRSARASSPATFFCSVQTVFRGRSRTPKSVHSRPTSILATPAAT